MRRGILLPKDKNLPTLGDWAKAGLRMFLTDERTKGYKPDQIQVNPQDNGFPHDLTINGLPVICNPEVKAGCLRVVTVDLGEDI